METNSRAMTGEYNPDLRQPYPNATYTVDGRFHYTTDAWPRTLLLEVDMLGDVAERFRCRSDSVQGHFKDYGKELASEYDTTYNGGHVAGARSGGPSEEINTVTMLEEVNQYRVDSQLESYKMFEENIAANPENFRNLVVEFKYPEPAGPEFTPADKVPTKFIATWNDASGKSMRRRFENVPAGKGGQ
ncbi:DNA/RNA non-specific endonuclease [Actinomyces naeslundii]